MTESRPCAKSSNARFMRSRVKYCLGETPKQAPNARCSPDALIKKRSHTAPTPEVESYFPEHLSRDILIADWQYDATEAPVETSSIFQSAGYDCLLCPRDKVQIGEGIWY